MPNVSYCVQENEVHYNPFVPYSERYLTFVALEDGTFSYQNGSGNYISYSLDNGSTWVRLGANENTPTVRASHKILWTGGAPVLYSANVTFSSTGKFNVEGSVMPLLFGKDFIISKNSLRGKNYAFYQLFKNCINLVSAENLSLPATELAEYCYADMFYGCTSLTTAPSLPATTLVDACYNNMFNGCTSLTTAPELKATTLASGCYWSMFQNCSNLSYVKCLATYIGAQLCISDWVDGVASEGIFVKDASMNAWTTGSSGIPSGWTVENA